MKEGYKMKNLKSENKIKTLITEYAKSCKVLQENNIEVDFNIRELEGSFINSLQEDLPNLYINLYTGLGGELELTVRFSNSTMQKSVKYVNSKVITSFHNEEYENLDDLKKAFNEVETVVNYLNGSRYSNLLQNYLNEKNNLEKNYAYTVVSSMRRDLVNNIEELLKVDSGDMKLSSTRSIKIASKYLYTYGWKETSYSKSDPESYKIIANYIVSYYVEGY